MTSALTPLVSRGGIRARSASARGSVLLVALGVLGLLTLLVLTFMANTRLERHASANYVDAQRAKLTAHAGLNRAIAEIERIAIQKPFDDRSPGGSAGNPSNPPGIDRWIFPVAPGTKISQATELSFDAGVLLLGEGSDALPVLLSGGVQSANSTSGGPPRHLSGSTGATYVNGRDVYALKILDAASQINVNLPNLESLDLMLRELCEHPRVGLASRAATVANAAVQRRPPGGWETKREVIEAIVNDTGITVDEARKLRDLITTVSFTDLTTLRPPLGLPALNPPAIRLEPRSPINLNTADEAVLSAVLANIAGLDRFGNAVRIDQAKARNLATAIVQRRDAAPFQSFGDLQDFVLAQALDVNQKSLVMANADPNSRLNKFNPDPNFYRPIDKSDLTTYTTEFCFSSMGFFEIQSLGTIFRADGEVGAESLLTSVVRVFSVYRDTTQRDFERGRQIGESVGTVRASDNFAWMGVLSGPEYSNLRDEVSLELLDDEDKRYTPADYDGHLFLNGLVGLKLTQKDGAFQDFTMGFVRGELVADTFPGSPLGQAASADPDTAPAVAKLQNAKPPKLANDVGEVNSDGDVRDRRLVNPRLPEGQNLPAGLLDAREFLFGGADLMPLGVRIEAGREQDGSLVAARQVAYDRFLELDSSNMSLPQGTIEFWVKPTFDTPSDLQLGNELREVFLHWGGDVGTSENCIQVSRLRAAGGDDAIEAFFSLGNFGGAALEPRRLAFPLNNSANDRFLSGEWHHIRVTYGKRNLNGSVGVVDAGLFVDGVPAPGNGGQFRTYDGNITVTPTAPNRGRQILGSTIPLSFDDIFDTASGNHREIGAFDPNPRPVNAEQKARHPGSGMSAGPDPDQRFPPEKLLTPGEVEPVVDFPGSLSSTVDVFSDFIESLAPPNLAQLRPASTGPVLVGRDNEDGNRASAVFDNILLLQFRADEPSADAPDRDVTEQFFPPARYNDGGVQGQGTLFRKTVSLFTGVPVRLGVISFSATPAFPAENDPVQRGDLNIQLSILPADVVDPDDDFVAPANEAADDSSDGNPGDNFGTTGRILNGEERERGWFSLGGRQLEATDLVSYSVDMRPVPSGVSGFTQAQRGLLQSPILDDVTITYFSSPQFLLTEEGGEE